MTVVMIQESVEMTPEMYDEVNAKLGVNQDPPEGLIVHTAGRDGDRFQVVDVWESREAYDRFNESRLGPAVREVAQAHGMQMGDAPGSRIYETHNIVRP